MEKTRMVHRSITAAFCTLLAAASAKAAVVTLHPLPALSTVPSRATGITGEMLKGVEKYLSGKTDRTMRASGIVRLGQNIHALFKRDKS